MFFVFGRPLFVLLLVPTYNALEFLEEEARGRFLLESNSVLTYHSQSPFLRNHIVLKCSCTCNQCSQESPKRPTITNLFVHLRVCFSHHLEVDHVRA